jgi:hypothetical protein
VSSSKKTETATVTPTNPQWVTDASKSIVDQGQTLMGQDPKSFIAGPQGLNQSLFDTVGGMAPNISGAFNQAGSLYGQLAGSGPNLASFNPATGSTATAAGYNPAMMDSAQIGATALAHGKTAYGGIDNYLNPYQQQVTNQTLSDLDRARQMANNSDGRDAILSGQYGGSREGVADEQNFRDYIDRAGAAAGQLNAQGFNTALGASQSDADRAQQANLTNVAAVNNQNLNQAQLDQQGSINNQNANNQAWQFNAGNAQQAGLQNAQLGQQNNQFNSTLGSQNSQFNAGQQDSVYTRMLQGAQGLGGLGATGLDALSGAGSTQQGIAQQQAGAPLSVYSLLSGDYQNSLPQLFQGKNSTGTTTSTPSLMDTGGKVLQAGANLAMMFSDARVKRDIETAGYDARGRRWVDYRYGWDADDAPKTRGVIAQEIAETDPDAVLMHPTGLLMVNYDMLGA